jgi:hypothetical protein
MTFIYFNAILIYFRSYGGTPRLNNSQPGAAPIVLHLSPKFPLLHRKKILFCFEKYLLSWYLIPHNIGGATNIYSWLKITKRTMLNVVFKTLNK